MLHTSSFCTSNLHCWYQIVMIYHQLVLWCLVLRLPPCGALLQNYFHTNIKNNFSFQLAVQFLDRMKIYPHMLLSTCLEWEKKPRMEWCQMDRTSKPCHPPLETVQWQTQAPQPIKDSSNNKCHKLWMWVIFNLKHLLKVKTFSEKTSSTSSNLKTTNFSSIINTITQTIMIFSISTFYCTEPKYSQQSVICKF